MDGLERILVAVKNPEARRQPGVEKAIHIAKQLGASIELFNAITSPVFVELHPLSGNPLADMRREVLALRQQQLEKLATRARRRGV